MCLRTLKSQWRVMCLAMALVSSLALADPADPVPKLDPISTATVVQGVVAAGSAAVGINATLTTSAEVRAVATSGGPDNDDIALLFDQDTANTFLETNLRASTLEGGGTRELGPNGDGWGFFNPHKGTAIIEVSSPLTSTNWQPVSRSATAFARRDTTPVRGQNNTTAAVAIGTFHHLGTEVKTFTVSEQAVFPSKGEVLGLILGDGEEDAVFTSTGAVLWSVDHFRLQEAEGGMVTVTPPVERVELFHDFVQLSTSVPYRNPFSGAFVPPGPADTLLNEQLAFINAARDGDVGTVPLTDSDTVDFTLGAATLLLSPGQVARGEKTDREVIRDYLLSGAVTVVAPDAAQAGYEPDPILFEYTDGTTAAPEGSLFAVQGGLAGYYAELLDDGQTDPADMVGLIVETEGSLLLAMNRAALDPSHPIHAMINTKGAVGTQLDIQLIFQQSASVASASEATADVDCLLEDGALFPVLQGIGGDAFTEAALTRAVELERDVPTFNSNPLLAPQVPDCDTEVTEQTTGVVTLSSGQIQKQLDCAVTSLGLVACPPDQVPPPASGEWLVISMVLGSFLEADNTEFFYQFGFVFDSDGKADNNWVALPQFANDYFQGTDRWYTLNHSPSSGWSMGVTAVVDGNPAAAPSSARIIVRGNTLTLLVPRSEFPDANPKFRLTAFRHKGDFGQNPPHEWSADYHPRLDQPLAAVHGLSSTPVKPPKLIPLCGPRQSRGSGAAEAVLLLGMLLVLGLSMRTRRNQG